jgi:hypothetical protein
MRKKITAATVLDDYKSILAALQARYLGLITRCPKRADGIGVDLAVLELGCKVSDEPLNIISDCLRNLRAAIRAEEARRGQK